MTLQHVRALKVVAMLTAVGMVACGYDSSGPSVRRETFTTVLSGANEKPNAVQTSANGTATLVMFGNPADSITFDVKVAQIDSVTASHIHAGDVNTFGSIIFGFPSTNPPQSFTTLTQFQKGVITRASTFSGIFATAGFDSLITRLRAGTAYVNVHTKKYPAGEMRGNLVKQ